MRRAYKAASGAVVYSPEEGRELEIIELLREKHPESRDLISELGALVGDLMNDAVYRAVERHGRQIMATIEGRLWMPDEGDSPIDVTGLAARGTSFDLELEEVSA